MTRFREDAPLVIRARYAQGPLPQPQRLYVPGTTAYVEVRQERSTTGLHWDVEHGYVAAWGDQHSGTWGRSNAVEAAACFHAAVGYALQRVLTPPGRS